MSPLIGHPLPENWQPSDDDRAYCYKLGFGNLQIDAMAEDMRLWAGANAHRQIARKANWSMAFKGWARREASRQKPAEYRQKPAIPAGYERGNPNNWRQ
jgi:hypothetical protein